MNADGNVDVREVIYFNQIQNVVKITNDELKNGKEQNLLISLLTVKSMDNTKKLALGTMLVEMINADGRVDEKEMEFFNLVAQATGLVELVKQLSDKSK